MMRTMRFAGVPAAAAVIGSLAVVAPATAQPSLPEAGNETPGATIRQLSNAGYDVEVNWVAGEPSNIPLSQCTVTRIDTSAPPTAWVSVNCPPDGSQ
ncbi:MULTISPECIES: hypothetical protein [Mycolicibacterium]|uniref:PASTA domain-containing protein n=3 Tax=Mycolicibacterium gilvum TaxID=1804 RepID=E6TG14_MYCSR|nr:MULTISPECIES: hypothetical protein [Mycolicibacterium]ABP44218.1 hypothetical protein Mflv_1738 [Mycolicibacterium gilvum PYR-GCK]ADT97807.1 hypothetical protein Mspyr1_11240 [Mycolicibacterium gilvum Spyr1]MBV5246307.1 hypothetical protein [Mycolicibacterium sp. PAM1]MCV7057234.1 hypothetical protein [Mycolicibacterium gilvum]STZ45462.1 Uncharacterised protein [Mycolicibacterium gilvum]